MLSILWYALARSKMSMHHLLYSALFHPCLSLTLHDVIHGIFNEQNTWY